MNQLPKRGFTALVCSAMSRPLAPGNSTTVQPARGERIVAQNRLQSKAAAANLQSQRQQRLRKQATGDLDHAV
jgi:hypothetical protein